MKTLPSILLPFVFFALLISCQPETKTTGNHANPDENSSAYDSLLAIKTGADDYGMKHYVMAFLKAGPNRDQDSITASEIQKGHMANIQRLADEGKLVVAGPFEDDGELRGIFIFNVATLEEAKTLTESDPAVKAGRLIMELHPWYGSAAIMEINELHQKVTKKNF